ncbi:MAG: GNAT family N-acetyltransferase [Thiohalocapsa sp.]
MARTIEHQYTIRRANWEQDQEALRNLRQAVFVREQGVPEALEWDGRDDDSLHLIAEAGDGMAVGTARMLTSGQIGRMAVLPEWRDRGIGTRLLAELLRIAHAEDCPARFLNAQIGAMPFYERLGFKAVGDGFDEAGIAHQRMELADAGLPLALDIRTRLLGQSAGLLRLTEPDMLRLAVATMAEQARRELRLLTPDLEPILYDQAPFLDQVSRLAVDRRGHLPVRILLVDAESPLRRGHRLIELSRKLSSAVQIQAVPAEFTEQSDHYLLADDSGYCLRRFNAPNAALVDFKAAAAVRRMQQGFEQLWAQGTVHVGLRRLHL